MDPGPSDAELAAVLTAASRVAVLGASATLSHAGHYVGAYLASVGYAVTGVNPRIAGQLLWGRPVLASLAELPDSTDLVDVFRPSEALAAHLPALLAMSPRPQCVWFQLGVRDDEVARALRAEGITVVQDRCTLAEHRRLRIPRR